VVVDLQLAGLDLRDVEDVVEDRQQGLARIPHHIQPLALRRGEILARHDLGHAEYAVQRRADFMAHIGQELGLGGVGRSRLVAGAHEIVHGPMQGLVMGGQLPEHRPNSDGEADAGGYEDQGRDDEERHGVAQDLDPRLFRGPGQFSERGAVGLDEGERGDLAGWGRADAAVGDA
jgi:hypothetical protein